jgi:hypothetical protein
MRIKLAILLVATISCSYPPAITITPLGTGQTYPPTPDSIPVALLTSTPECRYDAIASITAEGHVNSLSDAALTDTLRARARSVGGHAILNFSQGTRNVSEPGSSQLAGDYRVRTGTAIRFREATCTR